MNGAGRIEHNDGHGEPIAIGRQPDRAVVGHNRSIGQQG
jgi:hypothetical protein